MTATTTNLDWGNVLVNNGTVAKTDIFTVSGVGAISALSITGGAAPFVISTTNVALGSSNPVSTTATFTFGPLTTGAASTTVLARDIKSGVVQASLTVTLTGTGVAPVASVTAAQSLGNILVGQTATTTVVVRNIGNGDLATGGSASSVNNLRGTIGSSSSVFTGAGSVFNLADSNAGTAAVTSVAATYTFAPTSRGAQSSTISTTLLNGIGSTNSSGTASTVLSATGVAPVAAISTSSTNYFLVGTGGTATVTVSNTGNGNLSGLAASISNLRGSVSASAAGFTGSGGTASVGDTSSAAYTYSFAPTARGATVSTLVTAALVNGNASGNNAATTLTASLTGTGVAPVGTITNTAPSTYVLVGQSATATVSVANTGNGNLSGLGSASNLLGSVAAVTGTGFSGSGGSVSLGDTSAQTYSYTFAPTVRGASTGQVVATLTDGGGSTNSAFSQTVSLTSTGVAAVQSVTSGSLTNQVRVGTTATATTTVTNIGNGNLAGAGSAYNLNGSVVSTGLASGVTTSGGTFSLPDSATTTFGYTFAPLSRGSVTSTGVIAFSNGNSAGTNTSQTVSSVFTNQGVGPVYSSGLSTTSTGAGAVANTPTPVANGSIGAASGSINFGTVGYNKSLTVYLAIRNTTPDVAAASLTNMTIEGFSISGLNASSYSVTLTNGSVITAGGQLVVPITVLGTSLYGLLNSTLTIFTDESAALGGVGDTFTYSLTALSVPEPASIAVVGAGLAALAGLRRRRTAKT